jgi:hypothetical protein
MRDGMLSKIGLGLGVLVAVLVMAVVLVGRFQQVGQGQVTGSPTVPSPSAAPGDGGWEIRYTATIALAKRGSDLITERFGILAEMLDQDRQMQRFRTRLKRGGEVADEGEVVLSLTNALKAVAALHQRKPGLDLSPLYPAIHKLAESPNPALKAEAERTQIGLGLK